RPRPDSTTLELGAVPPRRRLPIVACVYRGTTPPCAATPDAVFDLIAANTPLRRVTTPDELADTVLFFASPWARSVTGQNLIVDGGLVFG
ncbi:SDR family oxidoreductase, partial [Gemmatimonas sp.]|uniref:SDR family oxidoreductase n=1 Tax=Gemmatimonas sp. TaxID=1962908 RepID=UPI00391FA2FC